MGSHAGDIDKDREEKEREVSDHESDQENSSDPRRGSSSLTRAGTRASSRLVGGALEGSKTIDLVRRLGSRLLPPYPGPDVVQPARLPAPPILDPNSTEKEVASVLAACYRGALEVAFGVESFAYTRGDISRARCFRQLVEAGNFLKTSRTAPAAWALFSVDVWVESGLGGKGMPNIGWVYAASRLRDRWDWFQDRRAEYAGGQVLFSGPHLALAADWRGMWDQLLREVPSRPERALVEQVLEAWFPERRGSCWEDRVEEARNHNRALQSKLDRAIESGVMVWRSR
jgi:hypothetical protein